MYFRHDDTIWSQRASLLYCIGPDNRTWRELRIAEMAATKKSVVLCKFGVKFLHFFLLFSLLSFPLQWPTLDSVELGTDPHLEIFNSNCKMWSFVILKRYIWTRIRAIWLLIATLNLFSGFLAWQYSLSTTSAVTCKYRYSSSSSCSSSNSSSSTTWARSMV